MKKSINRLKTHWLSLLPWGVVFVVLIYVSLSVPPDTIKRYIEQAGLLAPLVFILISLISYIIAPLSGAPLNIIGFSVFGEKTVLYASIAGWISFSTNFLVARRWGRGIVIKLIGSKAMHKVDKIVNDYGTTSLIFLRMFQGYMHDFISYAAGLTQMKFSTYLLSSTLGFIPGTLIWYWLAAWTQNPFLSVFFGWAVGLFFTGLYIAYKKWFNK